MEDFLKGGLSQATDGSVDPSFIIALSLLKLFGFCRCMSPICDRIQSEMEEEKMTSSLTIVLEQIPQVPSMIQLAFPVCKAA